MERPEWEYDLAMAPAVTQSAGPGEVEQHHDAFRFQDPVGQEAQAGPERGGPGVTGPADVEDAAGRRGIDAEHGDHPGNVATKNRRRVLELSADATGEDDLVGLRVQA